MTPTETLNTIQSRLASDPVPAIIAALMPRNITEATSWARCMPFWDEHRSTHSNQAIGIASVISKRAMKEFRLEFDESGRVVPKPELHRQWKQPKPSRTFTLEIEGQPVRVEYTPDYFMPGGKDYFYFKSPTNEAHPLSDTGHLSHFCWGNSVAACGGAEEYAKLYAQAVLEHRETEFVAAFEGKPPEIVPKRKGRRRVEKATDTESPAPSATPIVGEHTAVIVKQREANSPDIPGRQAELF